MEKKRKIEVKSYDLKDGGGIGFDLCFEDKKSDYRIILRRSVEGLYNSKDAQAALNTLNELNEKGVISQNEIAIIIKQILEKLSKK